MQISNIKWLLNLIIYIVFSYNNLYLLLYYKSWINTHSHLLIFHLVKWQLFPQWFFIFFFLIFDNLMDLLKNHRVKFPYFHILLCEEMIFPLPSQKKLWPHTSVNHFLSWKWNHHFIKKEMWKCPNLNYKFNWNSNN